jgi:hypothetical protein
MAVAIATQGCKNMSTLTLILVLVLTVGSVLIIGVMASRPALDPDGFIGEG